MTITSPSGHHHPGLLTHVKRTRDKRVFTVRHIRDGEMINARVKSNYSQIIFYGGGFLTAGSTKFALIVVWDAR